MGWSGPLTHRQYLAWRTWLQEDWNTPGRSDWYLMAIAFEVARGHVKDPGELHLEDFKLHSSMGAKKSEAKGPETREQGPDTSQPGKGASDDLEQDPTFPRKTWTREEYDAAMMKSAWLGRMTIAPVIVEVPRGE